MAESLEKKRARSARHYQANKVEIRAAARAAYAANPEEKRARNRVYNKTRWTVNREHSIAYHRKWKSENEEKSLIAVCRHRAKENGIPFDLVPGDIVYPEFCPVLGIRLERGTRMNPSSPSLDRLIPSLGYVRGNVHIISQRANVIKRDATVGELEKVLAYMRDKVAKEG